MTLLVIDTAHSLCSAALRAGGRKDAVFSEHAGRSHAERLASMVKALLAQEDVSPGDITRIGVNIGPGGFAGVRVGTAFARGLAMATGAACAGVLGLDVLARRAGDGLVAVAHDIRRGELVWRLYKDGEPQGDPTVSTYAEAGQAIRAAGAEMLAGNAADKLAQDGLIDSGVTELDMGALLDAAGAADPAAHPPSPYYVRPPDAEPPA